MKPIDLWVSEAIDEFGFRRAVTMECAEALSFIEADNVVCTIDNGAEGSLPVFDCFLPALSLMAMCEQRPLRLRGPASREMLINIGDFQRAWSAWLPRIFRGPVDVEADSVVDSLPPRPDGAVQAFSGGVDANFTTWTHRVSRQPHRHPLQRGVFVHGFDIERHDAIGYDNAARKIRRILDTVGVETSRVKTNIRQALRVDWELLHGAAIAMALGQFSATHSIGLIASSHTYGEMRLPWGSNPVTDPLMSGAAMRFVHDGAGFDRNEKIRALAGWSYAVDNLRVCFSGPNRWENCGVCGKCIRTAMGFEANGLPIPASFPPHILPDQIERIEIRNRDQLDAFRELIDLAQRNGIERPWIAPLLRKIEHAETVIGEQTNEPPESWARFMPA